MLQGKHNQQESRSGNNAAGKTWVGGVKKDGGLPIRADQTLLRRRQGAPREGWDGGEDEKKKEQTTPDGG